jgi:hypothetical protein
MEPDGDPPPDYLLPAPILLNRGWMSRSGILTPPRGAITELVHEIVSTPATVADLQSLAVVFQTAAEVDTFDPERLEAELTESPYFWLLRALPQNKAEVHDFIQTICAIVGVILVVAFGIATLHQKPPAPQAPVVVPPDQEKFIVDQLCEPDDENDPPAEETGPHGPKQPQ